MKISHRVIRADSKDAHIRTNKNKQDRCRIYSVSDEVDDLEHPYQEHDSAATSINSTKLPAIYRMINLQPGTVGIDFGGGKFDNAVEYLRDKDVTLCVYDPYNRSVEHNKEVLRTLRANGGADFAINSNVLNVIKEPSARRSVLENIKKITKIGAPIYITVYEGSGDGKEGATRSGYQLNRKTADYLEEIQEVFPDAKRKGKLIVATNKGSVNSSTVNASDEGYVYTYCDECGKKNRVKVSFKDWKSPFDDTEYDCEYCGAHNLLTDPHVYDDEGHVIESARNYGGAYDVDPEQYFTKDDIVDFGNYVCDSLDEIFYDSYDISEVYMETPKKLYLAIVQNSDGSEFECNVDIDMRKIRKPADIIREYGNDVVYSLRQQIESYNEVIESSYEVESTDDEIRKAISGDKSAIHSLKKQGYIVNRLVNPLQPAEIGTFEIIDPATGEIYNYDNTISYRADTKVTGSTALKRIARYGEFDNGRVFHNWTKMTDEQAEELAKQMSLENPDDVYYVEYDDLMDSCSDTRWINGQPYSFEDVGIRGGKPYIKNADVKSSQSYLDRIDELMEQGLDEETASREAYAEFYPDDYNPDDYDLDDSFDDYDDDTDEDDSLESITGAARLSVNKLKSELERAVQKVMTSPSWDFSKEDVAEYSAVEIKPFTDQAGLLVEVRAESDYSGMWELKDVCDPIVQKYDPEAYFDMMDVGIMQAFIDNSKTIKSSVEPAAAKYNKYTKLRFHDQDFGVHYTYVNTNPDADPREMFKEFKAAVREIHPYDDAEYAWAQLENGVVKYIKNGKVIKTSYYFNADDADVENNEWVDYVLTDALRQLHELNAEVEPRMIYNSTDASDNSITGAVYGPDSPDDDDEGNELDPQTVNIQMHLDADIQLTEESWNYVDTTYPWAASSDEAHKGAWYTTIKDTEVYLGDRVDMVQYTDELLATLLPDVPGTYHIAGDVDLTFIISGLVEFNNKYDESTYIETDWADVEFDIGNSSISDFKIDKK